MLLKCCKDLYLYYTETAHTINSLESVGKAYRWGRHKEYYFARLEFYRRLMESNAFVRHLNFPKIVMDFTMIGRNIKILEKNKHELRVYSNLGDVGDPNWNIGTFYK